MWILMLACMRSGDGPVDSNASIADSSDTGSYCEDVPDVRWANFGESFILHSCQGCHATTTPNRHGAPDDVDFDTLERVWEQKWFILGVATGDAPTMPPEGGVVDDDRTRLEWWLRCAPEGT